MKKKNLIKVEFCYEGDEPEKDPEYAEHHIYVISGDIVPLLKKAIELQQKAIEGILWR